MIHDATGYKLNKVDQDFIDRYIKEARAVIGDEAFEAAFKDGRSMRLKTGIELAREMEREVSARSGVVNRSRFSNYLWRYSF